MVQSLKITGVVPELVVAVSEAFARNGGSPVTVVGSGELKGASLRSLGG